MFILEPCLGAICKNGNRKEGFTEKMLANIDLVNKYQGKEASISSPLHILEVGIAIISESKLPIN